jgi:cytoskeletal protein CcmA (bactofilin family)
MLRNGPRFWRAITHALAGHDDPQVVLDRRQEDRRRWNETVERERRSTERREPPTNNHEEISCYLGAGTQFKGDMEFEGAVRVDGDLEGGCISGEVLIVGKLGRVIADIKVRILQISGRVQGNVTATQRVELLSPSRIIGTIRTPCLVISSGAAVIGNIEMASAIENCEL